MKENRDDDRMRSETGTPGEDRESGRPGGGRGRKDEVGGSGVFPASASGIPRDAEIRTPGEWGAGAGGEAGGQSELHFTEEELRAAEERERTEGGEQPDPERLDRSRE